MNQFFQTKLCVKCRGRGFCGKPCKIYHQIKEFMPKTKTHFSGDSPPEIFVGRYNYPNIHAGILSLDRANEEFLDGELKSQEFGALAMPEIWHKNKLSIDQILSNRGKLIYGRFKTQIKKAKVQDKFLGLMQEISMAYKSVSTEFFLKKPPRLKWEINRSSPLIGNPAPLEHARLQENPKVKPKVDYLIYDTDVKSVTSINELYKGKIPVSNINKILSAGLLGLKTQRKLVPTRWSITATDDTISKELLKKIRYYPEINEILLFHGYYVGNHYEFLLLPDKFAFEVLEAYMSGSVWNPHSNDVNISQDYEFFHGRKKYAFNVTGAYYTARLGLAEYFERVRKQGACLVMREERPEYNAPLGVGILRELSRAAFRGKPEKFDTIEGALKRSQERLKLPIETFTNKSVILKEYGKQRKLNEWF